MSFVAVVAWASDSGVVEVGGKWGVGGCEEKTRTKRRERNGSEVNCGTGVFVKILSKQSRKGPTYKKGGCLFLTHTQTNDESQKSQRGVEEGDGELRGQRREKEMTVRAGGGKAKEGSTWRDEPSEPNTTERLFSRFFAEFLESTASSNPKKHSPVVLEIKLPSYTYILPPNPASCLPAPVDILGATPADFEIAFRRLGRCRPLFSRVSHACYCPLFPFEPGT